jgi:hypothetical protein
MATRTTRMTRIDADFWWPDGHFFDFYRFARAFGDLWRVPFDYDFL